MLIELRGPAGGAGGNRLEISAGNSTVRGLVINGFSSGSAINLTTEDNNRVEGWIGTNANGTAAAANSNGVFIGFESSGNTIGGATPDKRNVISGHVISGNEIGISISAPGNTIQNNYIGTDKTGTAKIPNGSGIEVNLDNNQIGGAEAASTRNVISGNTNNGIMEGSSGNIIEDNFIGTRRARRRWPTFSESVSLTARRTPRLADWTGADRSSRFTTATASFSPSSFPDRRLRNY